MKKKTKKTAQTTVLKLILDTPGMVQTKLYLAPAEIYGINPENHFDLLIQMPLFCTLALELADLVTAMQPKDS